METRGTLPIDHFSDDEEEVGSDAGGATLQCTYEGCNKEFGSRWSLKRHLCTHTGEKSFECSICGKEFVQKCSLRRHEQTHTDSKTWVCNHANCGKHFKLKEYLDVHKRTHLKVDMVLTENLINVGNGSRPAVSTALNQNGLCDQLRQRLVRMSLRHRKEMAASSARFNALEQRLKEYEIGFLEAMTLLTAVLPDGRPDHLVTLMLQGGGGSSSAADQEGPAHKRARAGSSSTFSSSSSSAAALVLNSAAETSPIPSSKQF